MARRSGLTGEVQRLRRLTGPEEGPLAVAVDRYGAFLGLPATVADGS